MLLPLLGGVPAVWTTSILFFQAVLLAGYAYAHFAVNRLGPRRQSLVQVVLVLIPLLVLPIGLPHGARPPTDSNPIPWLLGTLVLTAGLPLFVVTSTGPLIQRWFAATPHRGARDPYFLFAASNLGSLLGLLVYPALLERTLSLRDQSHVWTVGYVVLIAFTVACAATLWRAEIQPEPRAERVEWPRRVRWVALAFVPSSLMLGVTAEITSEIAPIPLFWVVGLALYLLTLILAFSLRRPMPPGWLFRLLPALVLVVVFFTFLRPEHSPWLLALDLITFVIAAYCCHGQLAADRPDRRRLTDYYLWISVGGALGGLFNGVIAPLVFTRLAEFPLALFMACLLRPRFLRDARPRRVAVIAFASLVLAGLVTEAGAASVLLADRSFFGVYTVKLLDISGGRYHALVDGNTIHGMQSLDPRRANQPLLYFYDHSPVADVFRAARPKRVGVVGLGAGSLACYAKPGDRWTFFELDPHIEQIAKNGKLFTLLRRCDPHARVVLGDGRLSLAKQPDHSFDLIALDAFNSESVPVHLLTREALAIYLRKLGPDGLLVFNVTNHFVDLHSVLANLAANAGLLAYERDDLDAGRANGRAPSRWIVLTRTARRLPGWHRLAPDRSQRLWTDQYSNVLSVLRFRD